MIKIARYKNSRHWAVWQDEKLLAVVCYKKKGPEPSSKYSPTY